jgi:hypothetical protein
MCGFAHHCTTRNCCLEFRTGGSQVAWNRVGKWAGQARRPRCQTTCQTPRRQTPDARRQTDVGDAGAVSVCVVRPRLALHAAPRRTDRHNMDMDLVWGCINDRSRRCSARAALFLRIVDDAGAAAKQREALASTSRGAQAARLFMRILQLQRTGWMEMDVGVACCWWAWSRKPEAAEEV